MVGSPHPPVQAVDANRPELGHRQPAPTHLRRDASRSHHSKAGTALVRRLQSNRSRRRQSRAADASPDSRIRYRPRLHQHQSRAPRDHEPTHCGHPLSLSRRAPASAPGTRPTRPDRHTTRSPSRNHPIAAADRLSQGRYSRLALERGRRRHHRPQRCQDRLEEVHLNAQARLIIECQPRRQSAFVFPSVCNPQLPYRPHLPLWDRVRTEVGIEDVRLHDLRRTMPSHAVLNGVPVPVVSRLLGHSNVRMTLRYAHLADRDIEAAAERVGAAMARGIAL